MARRRLTDLSALDESLLAWQRLGVPWNAQLALAAHTIDAERARAAIDAALAHHPLARCAIDDDRRGRPYWAYDDTAGVGAVEVVACADEDALDRLRIAQITAPLPMGDAPLVRAVVARGAPEDLLIVTVSHVMTDGLGLLRFMRSVGRAYRDENDPTPAVDPVTAQSALAATPATSLTALAGEWSRRLRVAAVQMPRRSRLAARDPGEAGFGFVVASTSRGAVTEARGRYGASFDAYAMAALHVAIAEWNAVSGAPCERVGVSQGVNLRPDAWWDDCVLNLAAFVTVVTDPCDRVDVARALKVVTPQLAERHEHAREMVAAARAARAVPLAARAEVLAALPADQFDTCAISNCGVLEDPPRLDDHARPVAWIITPAMPQSGPTIAVDAIGDSLHFSVCYRTEQFAPAAAHAFVDAFLSALSSG